MVMAGSAFSQDQLKTRNASRPGVEAAAVGALPDSVDMVVEVRDLTRMRAGVAGRALERLLTEFSTWDRTRVAWGDLATALDMQADQCTDALVGGHVILAASGLDPLSALGEPQFAILSDISAATEAQLRSRLKPAPRALVEGLPILALENGAFELATAAPRTRHMYRPGTRIVEDVPASRVLLAPRGSSDLFDDLVPVLSGGTATSPLSLTSFWPRAREMGGRDVFFILRGSGQPQKGAVSETDEPFFALSGAMTDDGWSAWFLGSNDMILGGESPSPQAQPWPGVAVKALEPGALLLVAGSPSQRFGQAPVPSGDRTLLLDLLAMMELPTELENQVDGVALIAVHPDEAAGNAYGGIEGRRGVSVTAALPVGDLAGLAPKADAWAMSLTGVPYQGPDAAAPLGMVRAGIIPPAGPDLLHGYLQQGGTIAWAFVPSSDTPGPATGAGWWVINIRTTGGTDPSRCASSIQELGAMLAAEPGEDKTTLFRLIVRPAILRALGNPEGQPRSDPRMLATAHPKEPHVRPLGAAGSPVGEADQAGADPLSALRWLDRVETKILRAPRGQASGTVSLRLNVDLLDDSPRP